MSNDKLEVYPVGTHVNLTDSVNAKIITVAIHSDTYVTYECAWWNGESRVKEWFDPSDFESVGECKEPIQSGFHRE